MEIKMPVNFLDLFIVSIGEKICLKLLQVIIIQSENPDSFCLLYTGHNTVSLWHQSHLNFDNFTIM